MSALATPIPVASRQPAAPALRRRLFTADEFWRLYDLGFFGHERIRLIGGEIIEMAPQGNLHALGVQNTYDALELVFGPNYWVRNQATLDLSPMSLPDPDVAVVAGSVASYKGQNANPKTALLVVEVSYSTLSEDRNEMASLYASAGIADYWIVNIPDEQLEVRRDPRPDSTQRFGHGYASLTTLRRGEFASPLAVPNARVAVADLLPT